MKPPPLVLPKQLVPTNIGEECFATNGVFNARPSMNLERKGLAAAVVMRVSRLSGVPSGGGEDRCSVGWCASGDREHQASISVLASPQPCRRFAEKPGHV